MYLTHEEVSDYHRNGFVLVKNVFSKPEVERMLEAVDKGDRVANTTRSTMDQSGRKVNLAIWHELGEDIWSAASTYPRIVNNVRILLGEEAAFFHGKVIFKEARLGGAWEWHQDYGYWYDQGFLFPSMISAFISLDPATKENGCLKVLQGSHKLGRLNHGKVGNQTGINPSRIEQVNRMFKLVDCEMEAGSVLFFHCNLLHSSAANESDRDRRSFIVCYNAWSNPQMAENTIIRRDPCPISSEDAIMNRPK